MKQLKSALGKLFFLSHRNSFFLRRFKFVTLEIWFYYSKLYELSARKKSEGRRRKGISIEIFNLNSIVRTLSACLNTSPRHPFRVFTTQFLRHAFFMFLWKVFNILKNSSFFRSSHCLMPLSPSPEQHQNVLSEPRRKEKKSNIIQYVDFLIVIFASNSIFLLRFLSFILVFLPFFCRSWESTENNKCRISRWLK